MLQKIKQYIAALFSQLKIADTSFEKHLGLSEFHQHTVYQVNKNVKERVLNTAVKIYRAQQRSAAN